MRGENIKFMGSSPYAESDDPLKYLEKNVLAVGTVLDPQKAKPGMPVSLPSTDDTFDIIAEKYHQSIVKPSKVLDSTDADTGGVYASMVLLSKRADVTKESGGMGSSNGIPASYLGWGRGQVFTRELGSQHKIFITAQLSGCTFVAAGADRGAMTVAHYNGKVDPNKSEDVKMLQALGIKNAFTSQKAIDDDITSRGFRNKPYKFCFHPGLYPGEDELATIIGLRRKGEWTFYFQRYEKKANTFAYKILETAAVPALK